MHANGCGMHHVLIALFLFVRVPREGSCVAISPNTASPRNLRVVCYYRWLHWDLAPGQLKTLTRSPHDGRNRRATNSACTHIILGFASIGDDFKPNLTEVGGIQGVTRFINEGRPSPTTKMMLSFGGGGVGVGRSDRASSFSKMVANRTAVDRFQRSLSELIRETRLDGVDFDWEFPTLLQSGQFGRFLERTRSTLNDIGNAAILAARRKSAHDGSAAETGVTNVVGEQTESSTLPVQTDRQGQQESDVGDSPQTTTPPPHQATSTERPVQEKIDALELSVAVPGPFTLTAGYSPEHLRDNCTFISVMAYDLVLYEPWHPMAALHNALYGQGGILKILNPFAADYSMENWADIGVPKHMLLLGIPTYGVAYELSEASHTHHLAAVKGYSSLGANVAYDKTCEIIAKHPENVCFHNGARVPYVYDNKGDWISYDDERSVAEKATFAVEQGYGGVMIFSLNADDPSGKCAKILGDIRTKQHPVSVDAAEPEPSAEALSEPFPLTRIASFALNEAARAKTRTAFRG